MNSFIIIVLSEFLPLSWVAQSPLNSTQYTFTKAKVLLL